MTEKTFPLALADTAIERAALSSALGRYAQYHEDLATGMDRRDLVAKHLVWSDYYADLAAKVQGGQGRYNREDLLRMSEALDQYSGDLPADLRSVDTKLTQQLRTTQMPGPETTTLHQKERASRVNQPSSSSHVTI